VSEPPQQRPIVPLAKVGPNRSRTTPCERTIISDHYQALGVPPDADREEIRAAYLGLMRAYHPDHRPGDERAEDRARAANAAWEVLGDSARRAAYDRLRTVRSTSYERGPGRVAEHRSDAEVAFVAYSPERYRYRDDVTRGLLRFGVAAFAVGVALLLVLS
jgi:curved DNA-binding protein CbpA